VAILDHFLNALAVLFRDYPDLQEYLRLELYGNNNRAVNKSILKFSSQEMIHSHGKVQRREAVNAMQKADLLLLIQNTDDVSFETIPSKVYEYMHTGRPILALVYRNPELQAMLEEMGHIVVEADDEAAIRNGLETYISKWKQTEFQWKSSSSPYTVESAVDKLVSLANTFKTC
jgi:glycosyltransferase involved in cell wall biosynthesis